MRFAADRLRDACHALAAGTLTVGELESIRDELVEERATGAGLIAEERARQVGEHGYNAEHDDTHTRAELVMLAIFALGGGVPLGSDRIPDWVKAWHRKHRTAKTNARRLLILAGSFVAAELDRLSRLERHRAARAAHRTDDGKPRHTHP